MKLGIWLLILGVAMLSRAADAQPSAGLQLEDRSWRILAYRNGDSLVSPEVSTLEMRTPTPGREIKLTAPSVVFEKGHVSGSTACGALIGTYELSKVRLTISAGWFLAGWCPPHLEDSNKAFLKDLDRVTSYDGYTELVMLRDSGGHILFVMAP
jgi:heat shock protein HslJ